MPLGFERINARKSQPNERIVFIKPLAGPDQEIAQKYLELIAAQCLPVMRENHILVTSLEEYEPNREFVGRNFNAGEVIQLVLKSLSTKQWLPFTYVQMVMMHELAHCKQMNHSKAFWTVRNNYADQMRVLWSRGYTGEGLWGKGTSLETGEFIKNTVLSDKDLPEHLCGGTYRSRGRKRRAKPQPSYKERKERRILKKFGANGVALGEDEEIKTELEKGKKTQGKPRVAGSKRGRELRAAAALARFDQHKKEEETKEEADIKTEDDSGFETFSDTEDEAATDINGRRLIDNKGQGMVKVCEDENIKDEDARNELKELFQTTIKWKPDGSKKHGSTSVANEPQALKPVGQRGTKTDSKGDTKGASKGSAEKTNSAGPSNGKNLARDNKTTHSTMGVCVMCSFDNGPEAHICCVCSHVLDPSKVPDTWKCTSPTCRDTVYLNAGDSALCGVCGGRKAA
ncbi:WLM-domain-containing protein [Annulohypoxylon maeteangense]|uniref:WLM-domain-containing protein n=1 Tax=Annulohypoxylon maeteangense TaxID=1927788 RepID=UPI0020074E88|nr:WLM-domain-containing protein [Annulohypoxylon maeteangense]KAI0890425.1 WLM-domain-containing protein [Annulohypoxylon maeteangense]